MSQGLGQMQEGMGQAGLEGQDGQSGGPSNQELLDGLAGELGEIMKNLRRGQYLQAQSGQATSNWGYGTTNLRTDSAPGGTEGERSLRDVEGAGNERVAVEFDPLYAPEQIPAGTYDTRVRGRVGEGGATLFEEFRSLPTDAKGLRDYYSIVSAYTGSQERAMNAEEIPPEYRELVKNYFSLLNDPKEGLVPSESEAAADAAADSAENETGAESASRRPSREGSDGT